MYVIVMPSDFLWSQFSRLNHDQMKSQVRDTSWLAVGGARMALQDGSCRHCRFFINIEDDGGEVVHHICNVKLCPVYCKQYPEMEKAADAADTSVLFFSAGANF